MTGGETYVHDPAGTLQQGLNGEFVAAHAPDAEQLADVHALIERHHRHTGSARAAALLERWDERSRELVRVAPKAVEAQAVLAGVEDDAAAGGGK
jgi:glutamate synthase (NADPH/NADH) large chain